MVLAPGTKLGPYEILAPLGAGGMGEVYHARDIRLGRDVAVKMLHESFAHDPERLRRFEQEARAVAALNHPEILAIHDIGSYEGSPFLVTELLEGESLRAALDGGALPQRKAIEFGVQIAEGLAAAHEKCIVHRDLKPENIFVTKEGRIKILDFGLAKLAQTGPEPMDDVTRTSVQNTLAGVVMGTASYMAPEQVRGLAADPRTDIFAFGAVLFEMIAGVRAFRRDTVAETMTAVLKEDPPEFHDSSRLISPALERIVRRCLEKHPEQRFQSARDLSFALSALCGSDSGGVPQTTSAHTTGEVQPGRKHVLRRLFGALAVVAIVFGAWRLTRPPASSARLQFALAEQEELSVSHMALSHDGSMLAFVSPEENSGLPMLHVQRVGSPNVTLLPGTENASYPFWSPDGAYIAYFANGKLLKTAVSNGSPQVLATALSGRGGSWSAKDVLLYSPVPDGSIWRVNADGTAAAPVTDRIKTAQEHSHRWPLFLPDGRRFLFWAGNFGNRKDDRNSGIYVTDLDGKERKLVVLCHSSSGYDEHNLYYADDQRQLVSIAFDASGARVSGSPNVVVNAIGFQPATYWAAFAVTRNGTLIYNTTVGAAESGLTWIDRTGKRLGQIGAPAIMANPMLSPDESRALVDVSDEKANNVDIWIESTSGAGNSRFTFDPEEQVVGSWSRDGRTVAYRMTVPTGQALYLKRANGLERERQLLTVPEGDDIFPNSWTPDGKAILCTRQTESSYYLELVPLDGAKPTRFLTSKGSESNGQISPNGKWAAYASDESGNWEVYVTSFPGAEGKWQVSRGGGAEPRWRGDGKEIFYIAPSGMLTAVPVNGADEFTSGTPTPLFPIHGRASISSTDLFTYDVAKDGKRFLVNRYVEPEHVPPLTILLNQASGSSNP